MYRHDQETARRAEYPTLYIQSNRLCIASAHTSQHVEPARGESAGSGEERETRPGEPTGRAQTQSDDAPRGGAAIDLGRAARALPPATGPAVGASAPGSAHAGTDRTRGSGWTDKRKQAAAAPALRVACASAQQGSARAALLA